MKNCSGLLMLKFISLEFNDPLTSITEPFFMVDHKNVNDTPVPLPHPTKLGSFQWDDNSEIVDVEIPRDAPEVRLILCNRFDGLRWGVCKLKVSELKRSPLEIRMNVLSPPVTHPIEQLYRGDFDGGTVTFAYDFFETVFTTYRKFTLTSYFMALGMKPEADAEECSYYAVVDGCYRGDYTINGIGPYEPLVEHHLGLVWIGLVWNYWPNESTAVLEPFELGKFNEATQDHVTIVVHRAADHTIVATGKLQFGTLNEGSNGVTYPIPLHRDNQEVGFLFLKTEIAVEETYERASGYAGLTSSSEENSE